jgi:hypothetical protein
VFVLQFKLYHILIICKIKPRKNRAKNCAGKRRRKTAPALGPFQGGAGQFNLQFSVQKQSKIFVDKRKIVG